MTTKEAIKLLRRMQEPEVYEPQINEAAFNALDMAITALEQSENTRRGEWDLFEWITSAWYGKQCYFDEDDGKVYSRVSGKMLTVDEAIKEFLKEINDG